jgi:hypothetical protein
MIRKTLAMISIFFLMSCFLLNIFNLPGDGDPQVEEQAVYAAILRKMYPAPMVVLTDHTATDISGDLSDETLRYIDKNMGGALTQDLLDGFKARNDQSYPLAEGLNIGVDYVLISDAHMDEIFNDAQDGWDVFYSQYPNAPGIITVSRVGFNNQFDRALVYVGCQSHWLAGAGFYVLLKKVNGEWVVDQKVMTWIS